MSKAAVERLVDELRLIEEKLPSENPATRRIAIRSMYSSLEALASAIMSSAIIQFPEPSPNAPHAERHQYFLEICALSDISYRIDNNGNLKIESPKLRFRNRLLFALSMRAKASGIDLNLKQVPGWEDFVQATKIRNRVTHPRSEAELTVSKEDYDTAVKGLQWVIRCNHRACGGQDF